MTRTQRIKTVTHDPRSWINIATLFAVIGLAVPVYMNATSSAEDYGREAGGITERVDQNARSIDYQRGRMDQMDQQLSDLSHQMATTTRDVRWIRDSLERAGFEGD